MAQTRQRVVCVGQSPLVDHGAEKPRERALLAVTCNVRHGAGVRETLVGPDTCPVVDEDTCQLYTVVEIANAYRQQTSTL